MYVQVITFNLNGMTEDEWRAAAQRNASTYTECPGLLAKLWMASSENNTYGAVYLWKDRAALDAYNSGPLTERIRNHPNYENLSMKEYELLDDLVELTQPGLKIV